MVALIAASMRHLWDTERVQGLLQPVALKLQENKIYLLMMGIASFMMCIFYFQYAGEGTVSSWSIDMETYVCYVHAGEVAILLVFNCAQSQEDILRFSTSRLFSDCFVVVSVLIRGKMGNKSWYSFSFCSALRARNLWNAYEENMSPLDKGFKSKMFHEGVQFAARIYVFAAVIKGVESFTGTPWMHAEWEGWDTATDVSQVWTTHSSLYFILCTLTTVGYGDLQPKSIIGQVLLMCIIILGIGFLLLTIVKFFEIFQGAASGGGEYRVASATRLRRHIVVTGSPCAQTLQELLEELYHPDHEEAAQNMDTVFLLLPGSNAVMARVKRWLHLEENRRILSKVYMLTGTPLHSRDLDRAKLDASSLAIILPNTHSADEEREDIENAMRSLAMHRHTPYVRLVALLCRVEFRDMFVAAGLTHKDLVCVDEIKLGILGKACECQGFITLVCNLFKSAGEYENSGEDPPSVGDYKTGMGNEIYEIRLATCYRGAPFGEVATDILDRSDALAYMIGVIDESRYPGEDPVIRMHPGRLYRLGEDENYLLKGVFIAPDPECIKQHPPDKPFSWHLDKGGNAANNGSDGPPISTVPGQVVDDSNILVRHAQRWLPDPRVVKREFKQKTKESMEGAASLRTVQGLKTMADVPRDEVEEILEKKVTDATWKGVMDLGGLEDDAQDNGDPNMAALKQQRLDAAKAQEKEKQKAQEELRTRAEGRNRKRCERLVTAIEAKIEAEKDQHQSNEEKIDLLLWGGPRSPRKPLFGNPKPPPTSVLVRGEHVVMLALEGNEVQASVSNELESTGCKLGLEHFMSALRAAVPEYATRPVVVLSQRVPYDWLRVATEYKDVYFIPGRPLAEENLELSGIANAKSVIIYQRGAVTTNDPTLVDAQAIFAAVLAESLIIKLKKDLLCIVDLNLHENSYFVAAEEQDDIEKPEEVTDAVANKILSKKMTIYSDTQRYMRGELFASSQAITSLVANMLYNPALSALVGKMLSCRFVTVAMPWSFLHQNKFTVRELYKFMLRKRNLIFIALLRRFDEKHDDELTEIQDFGAEHDDYKPEKYDPKAMDINKARYMYTMPPGEKRVSPQDGVVCIVPPGDSFCFID